MKISALTAATTPLSGAELFPIVQSGNTRRVSLNDLLRSIGNGTAAAPALAPGGDPNTGIYFPAADTIGFVEGGVEVMRIDANGRVGIGTTSPIVPLHVAGQVHIQPSTANNALLTFRHGSLATSNYIEGRVNSSTIFGTANADRMTLDASGNLGLGVTPSANWFSGASALQFGARGGLASSSTYTGLTHNLVATSGGYAVQYMLSAAAAAYLQGAGTHEWYSAPSGTAGNVATLAQRMLLTAAGNLGIGVTPSAFATVNAVQVSHGSLFATTSAAHVGSNVFFDGSYKYIGSDWASRYQQFQGVHSWHTAASGTAGAAITFTQAMTLSAAGNLTIGGTNDSARLRVEGTTNLTAGIQLFRSGNICGAIWTEASALRFGIDGSTGFTERWQINSSGHLLAATDATFDIGASGATRPRDLHLGRNLVGAGWLRAGAASAGAASTTTIGGTTATTVGAAGAASALPANPLGYIVAHVGTTEVRIPYYNA